MNLSIQNIFIGLFEPLYLASSDKSYALDLLDDLGWNVSFTQQQYETFSNIVNVSQNLNAFVNSLQSVRDRNITAQDVELFIQSAEGIFSDIQSLKNIDLAALAQLPEPLNTIDFWISLTEDIPHYLVSRYIRIFYPVAYEIMYFSGAIEETPIQNTNKIKRRLIWASFLQLLTALPERLANQYQWGDDFSHENLISNVHRICNAIGIVQEKKGVRQDYLDLYYGFTPVDTPSELYTTIYNGRVGNEGAFIESSVSLLPVPTLQNQEISGLGIMGSLSGDISSEINVSESSSLTITAGADMSGVLALILQPDNVYLSTEIPNLNFNIAWNTYPQIPWTLIGSPEKTRLEISGFNAELSVQTNDTDHEFVITGKIKNQSNTGLKLVIAPGEADSFISKILGEDELIIGTDLEALWSSKTGFAIEAGGVPSLSINTDIPINLDLGVIRADTFHIKASATPEGASLKTTVSGSFDIKVLKAVAEDIGLEAKLIKVENNQGALGPFDLKLGFKPPSGLGISIEAKDIVKGGGYLDFDPDEARYSGSAEFQFTKLSLAAMGVLTTRMPDGSKDWSLFLSIFSEFPAIQLGFGFTLNGVGGLIGINRALDDEALRQRMLAGAMDSIMFPEDPVENAPQIIRDIEAIFPPVEGQFVFGVMMKFSWGTPTILSVDLGVMVELPDPVRIALLGQISAFLPVPDAVIVELHMDVFGLADITGRSLSIDAVLRDSHIINLITLSGDMALRANFLGRPNMLMAIGGFHPDFNPPPGFPQLRRIKAFLPLGDEASVDLSAYTAFTSNTFQIGGRLDVWASVSGFTAEGYIEMDALIQFAPFGFDVHVEFGVSITAGKINLMAIQVGADIRGPGRWEILGYAQFEILGAKQKVPIEIRFGNPSNDLAEMFNVGKLVHSALSDDKAWEVKGGATEEFIRFRERADTTERVIHPDGKVDILQKIAPLDTEIEIFGSGQITGDKTFEVESILIGNNQQEIEDNAYISEWFAPANFYEMDDAEKITSPSFQEMNGGVSVQFDEIQAGEAIDLKIKHEEICIDTLLNQRRKHKKQRAPLSDKHLVKFDKTNSAHKWAQLNDKTAQKIEPQFIVN